MSRPHLARARVTVCPAVVLVLAVALSGLTTSGVGSAAAAGPTWPSAAEANAAIGNGVEVLPACCGVVRNVDIEAQARAARSRGFTGVRYAVWLEPEFVEGAVDQTDPDWLDKWLDRLRAEIDVLTAHGLTVVVNFNQNLNNDRTGDRIARRWAKVAERWRDLPPSVYFEILNEPNWTGGFDPANAVGPDDWNAIVAKVIPAIRATNPNRIIVVTGALWSLPQVLPDLKLPAGDEHLIATFHNYLPLQFTHQGVFGEASKAWIGTTWTGTPGQVAAMKATMNDAVCWSRRTGVPLFVGEFSSYNAGTYTDQNPMLWNKTMVQLMEAENISWTYFLLTGHQDPDTHRISFDSLWDGFVDAWNQPVLDALEQGRLERIEPWATCTPPTTPTTPAAAPADSTGSQTQPVVVTPRFTG